jgi:hypothetical protein
MLGAFARALRWARNSQQEREREQRYIIRKNNNNCVQLWGRYGRADIIFDSPAMKKRRWENCQVAPLISFVAMDTPLTQLRNFPRAQHSLTLSIQVILCYAGPGATTNQRRRRPSQRKQTPWDQQMR